MPVFLTIWRVAQCGVCFGQWPLDGVDDVPERCLHCGTASWMWGVEPVDNRLIRQGIAKNQKVLNPGATSLKRQKWGRKQYRQFREKPMEPTAEE